MSEKKMLQGIASILEETLPEDWSKVVFYAEYAEGAFSIEYYVAGSGKDDFVKCFDRKEMGIDDAYSPFQRQVQS